MIVIMIYLGILPILKTKDPVSIKLFLSGVIIFLLAFILWNIGKYYSISLLKIEVSWIQIPDVLQARAIWLVWIIIQKECISTFTFTECASIFMNLDTDKYLYVSFNISFLKTTIYKSISFSMFLGPLLNVWCLYSEVFWQLLSVACWQHADIWGYQSYRVTKFPTRPLSPLIQHSPAPGSVKQCQEREDNWEGKSLKES